MTLEEARKAIQGRPATPPRVIWSTRPGEAETGVITEVRKSLVFVRFGSQVNAKGCYPEDLTLMRGSSVAEHILLNQREAGFPAYGDADGFRYCDQEV